MPRSYVLTIVCPDRPGIVHGVSGFLVEHGGNILESQQYDDLAEGRFFMRGTFAVEAATGTVESLRAGFGPVGGRVGMTGGLWGAPGADRARGPVSQVRHCPHDLLVPW